MSAPTLSIRQAASASGVSAHTLRYYERIGLLPAVARDATGRRRYTERDLGAVNIIRRLRATGMPIQGMKRFAALLAAGESAIPERLVLLETHGAAVRAQIQHLEQNLEAIDAKIQIYRNHQAQPPAAIPPAETVQGQSSEVT